MPAFARTRRRGGEERTRCPRCRHRCELHCPRHPETRATYRCTRCQEFLCPACVQHLRGKGGNALKFCSLCTSPCEPVERNEAKRESLIGRLQSKVKARLVPGLKLKTKKAK